MQILLKGLNEERSVKRCISDFIDEPFAERILVVDGGSTDYTVQELKRFPKVEVFVHPWIDSYHGMECSQSNIGLSYIPENSLVVILDFDERFSGELKEYLNTLDESTIPTGCAGHFSRKTYEVLRYENSPHAILDDDGWPILANAIGQYPDYQNRLLRKTYKMHWINSPHHVMIGHDSVLNIQKDIIHYQKDDLRDRERIEKRWARAQARRTELGLSADVFETQIKPEIAEFYSPEGWK